MATAESGSIVRVGTAGWSYEDWKGIVYPPSAPRDFHPLTMLSELFDVVEVNSSFYRPPVANHCASWLEKSSANPNFKFTVKLWDRFTHRRASFPTDEEVAIFCEGISPLHEAGKLGAILIQFPWSYKRTPENRQWLARVIDRFADYPLALEIRHASWNRQELFEGLAQRHVAFCNIDQPLFGNSMEPTAEVTAPLAYVRLHGRNHKDWFREDAGRDDRYNYLYSEEELRPWIEKIAHLRKKAKEIYAITNNHYRGQAVVNAFEIQHSLGAPPRKLPEHLVDQYPRLKHLLRAPLL